MLPLFRPARSCAGACSPDCNSAKPFYSRFYIIYLCEWREREFVELSVITDFFVYVCVCVCVYPSQVVVSSVQPLLYEAALWNEKAQTKSATFVPDSLYISCFFVSFFCGVFVSSSVYGKAGFWACIDWRIIITLLPASGGFVVTEVPARLLFMICRRRTHTHSEFFDQRAFRFCFSVLLVTGYLRTAVYQCGAEKYRDPHQTSDHRSFSSYVFEAVPESDRDRPRYLSNACCFRLLLSEKSHTLSSIQQKHSYRPFHNAF